MQFTVVESRTPAACEKDDGKAPFVDNAYRQTYYHDSEKRWFVIALVQEKDWLGLCEALGEEAGKKFLSDPIYSSFDLRRKNTIRLKEELQPIFATRPRQFWLDALMAVSVVCAPINTLVEVTKEQHNWDNGYLQTVEHPEWGRVRVQGTPTLFHGTPAPPPSIAPGLGEHTADVIRSVGLNLQELVAAGAVGAPPGGTKARL